MARLEVSSALGLPSPFWFQGHRFRRTPSCICRHIGTQIWLLRCNCFFVASKNLEAVRPKVPGGEPQSADAEAPPQVEHRRATRYDFGGVAELMIWERADLESGQVVVALVRGLNLYGCFMKTRRQLPVGAKVMLRMTHSETRFSATGRVVHQAKDGVGFEFTEIGPADRERLEELLATPRKQRSQRAD
jgi:hypothetical protein